MSQFAVHFVSLLRPVMLPLRFAGACSVLGFVMWSLSSFVMDIVAEAKRMHQIPCTKCRFFTGDYHLKCTVNPHIANTEQAIDCSEYQQDCHNIQQS